MSDTSDRVNILLVDDQPAKLISYEVMLGELNENLVKASSAREAFTYLLKHDVAVVLVDVCMPELDGFELAAMIREHPRFERTAIIFVSAIHMADDDRLRGYRMGAVDYMPVPVIPDILRAKVKVFAELYRKTRQLEVLNRELESRVSARTMELASSNSKLLDSERRRSVALAAGRLGSWDWDIEKDVFHWDDEHFRIVGVDPATFRISAENVRPLLHPDDWPKLDSLLAEARDGKHAFQFEARFRRPDGEQRWCAVTAAASFDGAGRLTRLSGVTSDITDRKAAEERSVLLAREVDHRAKNALALVQSILRLTKASSIESYREAIDGRIASLSHAHTLLSESRWQGAELQTLVNDELAPYGRGEGLSINGSPIRLPPATAQSLALVLHELTTNSAKYGALSEKAGVLKVSWMLNERGLQLLWQEQCGRKITSPKKSGFGMKVVRATVESQLRGEVKFDWKENGLDCVFTVPLVDSSAGRGGYWTGMGVDYSPVEPENRKHKESVLLVEDEVLVGFLMRDLLHDLGINTIGPCGSVAEALIIAQSR